MIIINQTSESNLENQHFNKITIQKSQIKNWKSEAVENIDSQTDEALKFENQSAKLKNTNQLQIWLKLLIKKAWIVQKIETKVI